MSFLAIKHLSFAYAGGPRALDGICLDIVEGESIAIVGPNGAGKSTLFLCVCGLLPVNPGSIQLCGMDPATKQDRRRLPEVVGIVFQDPDDQIFNATVAEDVAFGPLNLGLPLFEVKERVRQGLEDVGLVGFDGKAPFRLSGGEKRRVALAGALAMKPRLLLLDEPSSDLDPRGRRDLIRLIQTLGTTKIIATHDLELVVATCRRTIVLDRGSVIADGSTRTILADADLMEAHGLEVPLSLKYGCANDESAQ